MATSTIKNQGISTRTVTPTDVQNGTFNTVQVNQSGSVINLYVSFTLNTAMSPSTEYVIGTLPSGCRPKAYSNIGGLVYVGSILSSGLMRIRPLIAVNSGATANLSATYLTA